MKSLEDLIKLRDTAQRNLKMHFVNGGKRIQIGMGTCGIAAGAKVVYDKFAEQIQKRNLDHVTLVQVGCMGECAFEPVVEVLESGGNRTIYCHVSERMVEEIVEEHIIDGIPIEKYFLSGVKR